ncbi:MAG: hypothetical protein IPO08_07640 [Xanthomonadales bacterium]|jgi:hypothetical protein|nr:hypothetical protein [Xanthomonadales bacterium]
MRHAIFAVLLSVWMLPVAAQSGFSADLRLRAEHTDVPNRALLQRERANARLQWEGLWGESIEYATGLRLAIGSDANVDNGVNLDNQRSDAVELDRAFVRGHWGEAHAWTLGRDVLPMSLSPLLWDPDLRPTGVSVDLHWGVRDFDGLQVTAGVFEPGLRIGSEARLAALQMGYRWRDGAPWRMSLLLSLLYFDHLDALPANGLARTNRVLNARLLSNYRLHDVQWIGHGEVAGQAMQLHINWVVNQGAQDHNQAARIALQWGDRRQPQTWEIGIAQQRQQRDAVLAAVSDDEWWFHSFTRGGMLWLGYGISERWSVRFAGFRERRDDAGAHAARVLLDLEARW